MSRLRVREPELLGGYQGAYDGAGQDTDFQVRGGAVQAFGEQVGEHVRGDEHVVHRAGPDLGDGVAQAGSFEGLGLVGGGDLEYGVGDGGAEGLQDREVGRLRAEGGGEQRVVVVGEDQVFLGREVAVQRARGHVGRGGDLLHGGGAVAGLAEQAERMPLDRGTRLRLLAFPEAGRRRRRS